MATIQQLFPGLRREPAVLRIDYFFLVNLRIDFKSKLKLLPVQGLLIAVDVIPQIENLLLTMGDTVQSREKMVLGLYDKAVTF